MRPRPHRRRHLRSAPDLAVDSLLGQRLLVRPANLSIAEVLEGAISLFDAPPLPTTTEQCKNGGWKTYGVFKNQGDCVASSPVVPE